MLPAGDEQQLCRFPAKETKSSQEFHHQKSRNPAELFLPWGLPSPFFFRLTQRNTTWLTISERSGTACFRQFDGARD